MRHFLHRFNEFFSRLSHTIIFISVSLLVILLGYVDYETGVELSTSFLYLIPIFIATWYLSLRAGYFTTAISITLWGVANFLAGEELSSEIIRYWNISVRMVTFFMFVWLLNELKLALQNESDLARKDSLTGIKNHREFYIKAELELSYARRTRQPFSIAYFGLDSFKQVNDKQGHQAGDQMLQTVAHTVSNIIRKSDLFARLGGDEFVLYLPNTAQEEARHAMEKIEKTITYEMSTLTPSITLSIGVVTFYSPPNTVAEMISKADSLMYQAKSMGKGKSLYFLVE